jgi:RNA polymerase sigma-70 factor, ECF subfamily
LPRDKKAILQELLVLRLKRSERQAFAELVSQWEGRLFYYLRRLINKEEDAWDVLQQTWLKIFKGVKSLDAAENLPTWLYQVARFTAMSHWRSRYRTQAWMESSGNVEEIATDDENDRFEDAEQVHHALSLISLPHREVLTLFFLEDLSLEQMAEVLEIPPGTIKSRLHYAKRAIRNAIEQEEGKL